MEPPASRPLRRWLLGGLVALGGGSLFLAGFHFGQRQPQPPASGTARAAPRRPFRAVFSPTFITDPQVLDEQRKVVTALERACAQQRRECATARAARAYLDAHP